MSRCLAPPPTHEDGDLRPLMGFVAGWMYLGVGFVGLVGAAIPALRYHFVWQIGLGIGVVFYGTLTVADVAHWTRRPMWTHVLAMALALPVMALGIWATGGPRSYLLPLLLLAPIHWAFFLERRRTVAFLVLGMVVAMWAPLLDPRVHAGAAGLSALAMRSVTVCVLGAVVVLIRGRLRAAEGRLREQTRLDPLTGLLNRRGFTSELDRLLERTPPHGQRPMLIVLDLDDLKCINDMYGHPAGDQALRVFAQRLSAALRRDDVAARLGGDEFAVAGLVPDEAIASEIAARLADAVSGQLDIAPPIRVAATAGWAVLEAGHPPGDAAAADLMLLADRCLLTNKHQRVLRVSQAEPQARGRSSRLRMPSRPALPDDRPAIPTA